MADNKLLAEIARKGGGRLLNAVIDKVLPVATEVEAGVEAAASSSKKKTLLGGIAGAMAVRIATRSVPGAIVVGGSLLAKRLYDRRHAKRGPVDKATAEKAPGKA